MIRVIRGYYHWCLLDSHFNCWLQQIYSRKFITTSWLLPKCHKPKAKGRMHTFFLLTETYAASLDDRHCLRVFACGASDATSIPQFSYLLHQEAGTN